MHNERDIEDLVQSELAKAGITVRHWRDNQQLYGENRVTVVGNRVSVMVRTGGASGRKALASSVSDTLSRLGVFGDVTVVADSEFGQYVVRATAV